MSGIMNLADMEKYFASVNDHLDSLRTDLNGLAGPIMVEDYYMFPNMPNALCLSFGDLDEG